MFDNPLATILSAIIALYLTLALRRHARASLVIWLATIIVVPVWLELRLGATLAPLSVLAVLLLPAIFHHWRGRLRSGDWLMVFFAAAATVSWALFDSPQAAWLSVFTQWIAAYLVGRVLAPVVGTAWINRAIAIAGTVVGAWALVEFAFDVHLFVNFAVELDNAKWHHLQMRGPYTRSEGAFGHSIAMGGFLALTVPFVLADRSSLPRRLAMLAVVLAGTFVTFSRGALVGAVAALVLGILFLNRRSLTSQARAALFFVAFVGSIALVPLAYNLLNSVSSDFDVSTEYRENLAATFIPDLHAFGLGDGVILYPGGRQTYREFTSIDNAYALMGLQLGWVPVAILLIGVFAVIVRIVRGRATPADIALVSQAIVLWTVALITQYGMAVFFIAGIAAAARALDDAPAPRGSPTARSTPRLLMT